MVNSEPACRQAGGEWDLILTKFFLASIIESFFNF